jgi:hypothetical protein
MRNILIGLIIMSCFVSCKKSVYVHDNSFCIYKNYITADIISYNISDMSTFKNNSEIHSSDVLRLNAYSFIQKADIENNKIQDSLFQFLCKAYLKCNAEYEMNRFGIDDNMRELMLKIPKNGCFYYCGQLLLQKSVQSMVFLQTDNANHFNYSNLLLFNIKDNKICSIVNLSKYCNENKEEDLSLKTYLIDNSTFISVSVPFDNEYTEYEWSLIKKSSKTKLQRSEGHKKQPPFRYCVFVVDPNGFVLLKPSDIKINNMDILNKKGKVKHINEI